MDSPLISLLLLVALAWAVLSDLLYRRIGNGLVLGLLAVWLLHAGADAWAGHAVWQAGLSTGLMAALVVLVVGFGLFIMRWMGAGDVKLMAVLSLWMGHDAFTFLMATSLAGGVLALGLPMLRQVERMVALSVVRLAAWMPALNLSVPVSLRTETAQGRGGIPYGLAIAAGAVIVLWGAA